MRRRTVSYLRDMDGGGLVREALATDGAVAARRPGPFTFADVRAMPSLVRGRLTALQDARAASIGCC